MTLEQRVEALERTLAARAAAEQPVSYYTSRYSGEEIDERLSLWDMPQLALANLGAGVRPNLLHNPYFVGGGSQQGGEQLPINQTGATSWTGSSSYVNLFDRWLGYVAGGGAEFKLTEEGLALPSFGSNISVVHRMPYSNAAMVGKTYTISAIIGGELITATGKVTATSATTTFFSGKGSNGTLVRLRYSATNGMFFEVVYPPNEGETVAYCKLEEGEGQTLAYKDSNSAWHLLPQPDMDYGTQLLKCQRYLFNPISRVDAVAPIGYGWVQTDTTAVIYVPTPPMRPGVNSVLIQSGTLYIESTSGAGPGAIAATGIELNTQTDNMAKLLVTGSGFPVGQGVGLQVRDRNAVLMFSRQL